MEYRIAAGAILLAFYGCYFGKMLMQWRRGIRTDQLGRGKRGERQVVEIVVKAVTVLVALVEVVYVCGFLPVRPLPLQVRWLGAGVGAAGVAFFAASVWVMRDNWRAGTPALGDTELVTDGIYRISRNPAFVGFDLTYIGILLLLFSWPLAFFSAAAILALHIQITCLEEPFCTAAFGESYAAYRRQVRRYLGRRGSGRPRS